MKKTPTLTILVLALLVGGPLAGCGSEPTVQVQVAEATPMSAAASAPAAALASAGSMTLPPAHPPMNAPAQQAPPLEPGAQMPANHPPLDAAAQQAPPLAPGAQMPANHPPMGGAPMGMELAPVDPNLGSGEKAIAWSVPTGWVSVPPSSTMRRAQYRVPGKGGDAECAVFYFGPGQGGDPKSNAERWASQFLGPDGQPGSAKMSTREMTGDGVRVLFVETRGTYLAGASMGGPGKPMPGQALLGAIAEGPDANWFFKMTGPEATIDEQRVAFEQMLKSLKKGS